MNARHSVLAASRAVKERKARTIAEQGQANGVRDQICQRD